ncbi:MAG: nucleotide exchange factor GrpE [Methylacidiphilales bacterium]|nr:nucleotide exchange factor GrpE [Candidatus Methylacidiphilales bacterium]
MEEPLKEDIIPLEEQPPKPAPETESKSATQPASQPGAPAPAPEPSVAELQEKVAQLQEKLLRLQADFDNSRKRLQRDKEDAIRFANESLLEELLPVIDNFELGLQAAANASDAKSIAQGMQMVKTQLQRFLSDCGVQEINTTGQKFDPHLHEAIGQQETTEHPDGTVLSQQRKGYKLRDRLMRPAAVIVAHAPSAAAAPSH